jgi:hypothetical protein
MDLIVWGIVANHCGLWLVRLQIQTLRRFQKHRTDRGPKHNKSTAVPSAQNRCYWLNNGAKSLFFFCVEARCWIQSRTLREADKERLDGYRGGEEQIRGHAEGRMKGRWMSEEIQDPDKLGPVVYTCTRCAFASLRRRWVNQ